MKAKSIPRSVKACLIIIGTWIGMMLFAITFIVNVWLSVIAFLVSIVLWYSIAWRYGETLEAWGLVERKKKKTLKETIKEKMKK